MQLGRRLSLPNSCPLALLQKSALEVDIVSKCDECVSNLEDLQLLLIFNLASSGSLHEKQI